jgi:hypothetical protein
MKDLLQNPWRTAVLVLLVVGQCAQFILAPKTTAHLAYVDPGSGLMALQILASSAVGLFYLLRRKLSSLFSRAAALPESVPPTSVHRGDSDGDLS